jgi:hypothetical protein
MARRAAEPRDEPTEANPSEGVAVVLINEDAYLVSEGAWWRDEAGDYVIRSSEFDVVAGGDTFDEALGDFIREVIGYGGYLSELGSRAENEDEMLQLLTPRMFRITQALQIAERPPAHTARRRRGSPREWRSRQAGSRSALPV